MSIAAFRMRMMFPPEVVVVLTTGVTGGTVLLALSAVAVWGWLRRPVQFIINTWWPCCCGGHHHHHIPPKNEEDVDDDHLYNNNNKSNNNSNNRLVEHVVSKPQVDPPDLTHLSSSSSSSSSSKRRLDQKPTQSTPPPTPRRRRRVEGVEADGLLLLLLPPHAQRLVLKERRRRQLLPQLAMKKPMYDNIRMQDPNGTLRGTISLQKAQWYVNKQLAIWIEKKEEYPPSALAALEDPAHDSVGAPPRTIRLLFQPHRPIPSTSPIAPSTTITERSTNQNINHQQQEHLDTYNQSIKKNQCVACGASDFYLRHYIVPYAYRTLFPERFKTHLPHDVVPLCHACHVVAHQASQQKRQAWELDLRRQFIRHRLCSEPLSPGHDNNKSLEEWTAQPHWLDPIVVQVAQAARALLKWRSRLPPDQVATYEQRIRDWCRDEPTTTTKEASPHSFHDATTASSFFLVTPQLLERLSQLDPRRPNPDYVSGSDLVTQYITLSPDPIDPQTNRDDDDRFDDERIAALVRDWRAHFLETLQPRFLPPGWSIEAPCKAQVRPKKKASSAGP